MDIYGMKPGFPKLFPLKILNMSADILICKHLLILNKVRKEM